MRYIFGLLDEMVIFTLKNALFGAIKLTENAYKDKQKYSGYEIGSRARALLRMLKKERRIF